MEKIVDILLGKLTNNWTFNGHLFIYIFWSSMMPYGIAVRMITFFFDQFLQSYSIVVVKQRQWRCHPNWTSTEEKANNIQKWFLINLRLTVLGIEILVMKSFLYYSMRMIFRMLLKLKWLSTVWQKNSLI